MKSPPKMPQRAMVRIWVASLHQKSPAYESTLGFLFYKNLKFHFLGWIRTAAEPTTACGGNREARLGQRSDFSRPRQGVAEKSASATRKARRHTSRRQKGPCGQQRRPPPVADRGRSCWGRGQRYASKAQRMLGAATRAPFQCGSRNPPAPMKKPPV